MIPDLLQDKTTIVYPHSLKTHIWCILLRCLIGFGIITNKIPTLVILLLSLFIAIGFTFKYFKLPNVWKVYERTVLVYSIVFLLTVVYKEKYNWLSGTLIIVDALMGMQSRHIFEKIGLVIK